MYIFLRSIYMFSILYSASFHTSSIRNLAYIFHILIRRYLLILTAYKFLDIGIVVGHTSHVEITISDNRGNCIILPYVTWKAFIERRADIERLIDCSIIINIDSRSECRPLLKYVIRKT